MEPPHSGHDLANKVFKCLTDWGIDRKIFSITLDNANANDCMQNILAEQLRLQNSLLCDGEFFHVRCSAHILNLIVQEGLKVSSEALHKIRESIKYVRSSEARKIAFREAVFQVRGIDTRGGLRMDVPTRWNSTFLMLESAIKYRCAFGRLAIRDRNYKQCPSHEEWERAEKMYELLMPFYKITNLFSRTSYPTSNHYFPQVWQIKCLLRTNASSDDPIIKNMAERMQGKFSKYWDDYSVILSIAMVLDPKFKLVALLFYFAQLDPSTVDDKINHIKGKMYKLFDEYVNVRSGSSAGSSTQFVSPSLDDSHQGEVQGKKALDPIYEYVKFMSANVNVAGRTELDLYLDETPLEVQYFSNLDLLTYWKDRRERYPNLRRFACEVLNIPITTVASESAFSIGSRVLSKYRSRLLPDNVQALILTQNWLNGFEFDKSDEDNVDDEKEEEVVIDFTVRDSNAIPEQA